MRDDVIYGCLYPDDKNIYKSIDNGKSVTFLQSFPDKVKSIFITSQNSIFVCVKGAVYKSSDSGNSFKKVLELGSPISFFRHNNGMTETPNNTLIIAEYGNIWENNTWRKLAFLYYSFDGGDSWERSEFLIDKGTNKHAHLVKYSIALNKIFMADGDNKKKLWISDPILSSEHEPKWELVNKFHIQMGGYTSIVENDGKILLGTDYQGGTNFLVETRDGKNFEKRIMPDPYRRSPIINMVQRKSKRGTEIWAYLPYSTSNTKCLLMYSTNDGESWNSLIEYRKGSHKIWLASSSNEPVENLYFYIEDIKNNNRVVYRIDDL
ncbi:MAG: exo-alpha-sialidase [Chloroflexota bacterium]|nr:MAG: exo-alpha-sialidase [Chloroflexota bacterium]